MIKKGAIFVFIMVFTPFLVYSVVLLPSKFQIGATDSWLTFYSTFSGGILGGLIAYFVSKYQIKENNLQNEKNRVEAIVSNYKTLISYLNCVRSELLKLNGLVSKDNYSILETEVPFIEDYLIMINTVQHTQLQYKLIEVFNKINNLKELQKSILQIMKEKNYVNILYSFKDVTDRSICKDIQKTIELKIKLFLEQSEKIVHEIELLSSRDISAELKNNIGCY